MDNFKKKQLEGNLSRSAREAGPGYVRALTGQGEEHQGYISPDNLLVSSLTLKEHVENLYNFISNTEEIHKEIFTVLVEKDRQIINLYTRIDELKKYIDELTASELE